MLSISVIAEISGIFFTFRTTGVYCPSLKPTYIPNAPPTALKTTDDNEKISASHKLGMSPPIIEPTAIPNQIKVFCDMLKV